MNQYTRRMGVRIPSFSLPRALALVGGLVLTGTYVSVLYDVTTVVGDTELLIAVVLVAVALATVLAKVLRPRFAGLIGAGLFVGGIVAYVSAVPLGWHFLFNVGDVLIDVLALLSGVSLLRMTEAGTWAVGFAPAPVFLSWYLFVRRQYGFGVLVGGGTLLAMALTGDASSTVTLAGVVGATAALGFGEVERRTAAGNEMELVAALLAVMIVVSASFAFVPATEANPFFPERDSPTIEGGYVTADDRISVVGSIDLSPEVRFVVESNEPAYWRANSFDRYTGDGWVRSGSHHAAQGRLIGPPGESERITQTFTFESTLAVLPAAWKPIDISTTVKDRARVTSLGGFKPTSAIEAGESYTVVSERPVASNDELRAAGTDYPEEIASQYTQLPDSSTDRLAAFTDDLTADADTPYEKAVLIEHWLQTNKGYSLNVRQPSGDVADAFVFEMNNGYCVYFATAMVSMLRTQDVPARFVVGYGPGQRVAEDTWVVRELDSHAWVEVYFPEVGWVKFDPTPASPRESVRNDRLVDARERGEPGVDAAGSERGTWTPTPGPDEQEPGPNESDPEDGVTPTPDIADVDPGVDTSEYEQSSRDGASDFPREFFGFGLLVIVGLIAGVRQTGAVDRAQWIATVYWQRDRTNPRADVERAYDRLEYMLGHHYRPRRTVETRQQYLQTISLLGGDERIHRVGELTLRARYGGPVSIEEADEAVSLVDDLVRAYTPVLSRLRN